MISKLSELPLQLSSLAIKEFEEAKSLKEYIHVYGDSDANHSSTEVYWKTYAKAKYNDKGGAISFTRNSHNLINLNKEIVDYLESLLSVSISPQHIHLMKTIGQILPHIDEARTSVINIGLENSSKALTRVSLFQSCFGEIDKLNMTETRCQEFLPYALDVSKTHEVIPDKLDQYRYLVGYSTGYNYKDLVSFVKT